MLGTEAHAESRGEWQVRKWEPRAWVTPASGSSVRGGSHRVGYVGAWVMGDPARWGAPRVLHRPATQNCASSRHSEPWPSCIRDLPKTSIKFRPVHTQGNGVNGLFCKKFIVQR